MAVKSKGSKSNKLKFNPIFFIIYLLLLVVVFLAFEFLLRFADYGFSTDPFKRVNSTEGVYVDDASSYVKYYPKTSGNTDADSIKQNVFQMPKPSGVLRGIVLGGSTAQGFPYLKNQSWSKLIETAWKKTGAVHDIELLNLGRSAMSSYYVRDMASKVLKYDPDFVIIYAGHNDYYGTISHSTGSNHGARLLYLALKELKVFQSLFSLFAPTPQNKSTTVMAQQFADNLILMNNEVDRKIADDFIDNMNSAAKTLLEKGIPVIVFQPVSNLGMPPFAGAKKGMEDSLVNWNAMIESGNKEQAQSFSVKYNNAQYSNLATCVYLDAKTKALTTGEWPLDKLVLAKDLDASPFRARSSIVSALDTWAHKISAEDKNFLYIQTTDKLLSKYGQDGLTGKLFIDHLHFNFEGQRAIAELALNALSGLFNEKQQLKNGLDLLNNDKESRLAVHLTDLFEYRAVSSIEKLMKAPPFSTMVIKPNFSLENIKGGNTIYQNPELTRILEKAPGEEFFNRGMSYFHEAGIKVFEVQNIFAMAWANPGAPQSHKMVADYFASIGDKKNADEAYRKVSLLNDGR